MVFCRRCSDYECNIVKSMHYCVCMQHFSYATTPCKNIALTLQLCHNVVLCDNAMQLCCVKTLQQYELLRNSRRVWLSLTACVFSCMWSHLCWSLRGCVGATVFMCSQSHCCVIPSQHWIALKHSGIQTSLFPIALCQLCVVLMIEA